MCARNIGFTTARHNWDLTQWTTLSISTLLIILCAVDQLTLTEFVHVRSSVLFYLVDPDGQFVDYFAKNSTPQEIATRIASYADDRKRK